MTILLSVQEVTKRFGGLQALTDVSFELPEGQIMGLEKPRCSTSSMAFIRLIKGRYFSSERMSRMQRHTKWLEKV
jgi:branched-chain amino acid transport system ATP-binding protein